MSRSRGKGHSFVDIDDKMATTVVEIGPSSQRTAFVGSSENDRAYAKTFWQSVQLLPPMESRLVSSDIKQRLKVAPPGSQRKSLTYVAYALASRLYNYIA